MSNKTYPVIVGADAGDLPFADPRVIAYARVGASYVYCERREEDPSVLYYETSTGQVMALPAEAEVLARRVPINFEAMMDEEIALRFEAMVKMLEGGPSCTIRIENIDLLNESVTWYIGRVGGKANLKVDSLWEGDDTPITRDPAAVSAFCEKYRISLTCNSDLGEYPLWTATSPYYSNLEMHSPNRDRAAIQLVLLAHYQRNVRAYFSPDQMAKILKSHSPELEAV